MTDQTPATFASVVSGWALSGPADDTPAILSIEIDGVALDPVPLWRAEPGPGLALAALVPPVFWSGAPCAFSIRDADSGDILLDGTFMLPDFRLEQAAGLIGQAPALSDGFIRGWVTRDGGPLVVSCLVDGEEAARTLADAPAGPDGSLRLGYDFVLPLWMLEDGETHAVTVLGGPDGEMQVLGQLSIRPEDRREIGLMGQLDPVTPGCIAGSLRVPDGLHRPLMLTLAVNGEDRLQATPAPGGAFSFDTTGLTGIDPNSDEIEIFDNLFGAVLTWVPRDLIQTSVRARVDAAPKGAGTLVLSCGVPLGEIFEVWIDHDPAAAPMCIALKSGEHPCEAVAPLPRPLPEGARLRLSEGGPAIDIWMEKVEEESDARTGLGPFVAPDHARVAAALAVLAGAETALAGSPQQPEFSGRWNMPTPWLLTGWAIDLVRPDRRFEVDVHIAGLHVATVCADQMEMLEGSGLPCDWPLGFRIDLRRHFVPEGRHPVAVTIAGTGRPLKGPKESMLSWPPAEPTALHLRDLLAAPDAAGLSDSLRMAMLKVLDEPAARCLATVFTGHGGGGAPKAERLGSALLRLAEALLADHETWAALCDPARPLPHHRHLPPLLGVDMTPLIDVLPLPDDQIQALRDCTTWRGFLIRLLDPDLFAHLLGAWKPDRVMQLDRMTALRAGQDTAVPRLQVALTRGQRGRGGLPEALDEAQRLAVCDATGRVLLDERITRRMGAHLVLGKLHHLTGMAAAGDLYILVFGKADRKLYHLDLRIEEPAPEPRVVPALNVVSMAFSGDFCRVTCVGSIEPDLLFLHLEGGTYKLRLGLVPGAVAVPAGAEATRHYTARLPVTVPRSLQLGLIPCGPGKYDLRVGSATGPRPGSLPGKVTTDPDGEIRVDEIRFLDGQLVGSVSSTLPRAEQLRLRLAGQAAEDDPGAEHQIFGQAAVAASPPTAPKSFAIRLPASLLDGQTRTLSLLIGLPGGEERVFWRTDFAADDSFLERQVAAFGDREACKGFLIRVAQAGQVRFIEALFADLQRYTPHVFDAVTSFEIIAAALIQAPGGTTPDGLSRLLDKLWTHAATVEGRQEVFVDISRRTLLAARLEGTFRRYPQSPVAEALVDLLQISAPTSADAMHQRFAEAQDLRRFALAQRYLDAGLRVHPKNPRLMVDRALLAMQNGKPAEAEAQARQALLIKGKYRDAQVVLARALANQNRPVEALATLTDGKGLTAWLNKAPEYEVMKTTASLDWPGAYRAAAQAGGRKTMLDDADRAAAVSGPALSLADVAYSLFFLPGVAAEHGHHKLFSALRAAGQRCTQVATLENDIVAEMECTGSWAFVIARPMEVGPVLLQAIVAQMRATEAVARLVICPLDKVGAPTQVETVGAVIRSDALRAFGPLGFAEFMTRAGTALRVKTVLI